MYNSDVFPEIVREKNFSFRELEYLTNICFESNNYLNNFPQVFHNDNKENLFLYKINGLAVSFCSIHPIHFQLPNLALSSYCIGSVCTHPNFRKKGFAKKLLMEVECKAKENQVDFLFLFSDFKALYTDLNYVPAGNTYLAQVNSRIPSPNYLNKLKKFKSEYNKAVQKFAEKKLDFSNINYLDVIDDRKKYDIWQFIVRNAPKSESILSYLEFSDILKIKNMQLFILSHEKKICAIAFVNKGDDFQNVIHSLYFSEFNYSLILLHDVIVNNNEEELIFFPGSHSSKFFSLFDFQSIPSLFLKSLDEKKIATQKLQELCEKNDIFIGSLQGT
ncbi:GNAT family N-acetyltransferase [Fluviispira vulneris]|uniref:GNAT family N-acetyltransferase n=1 Tax=Fluviispira vulneris TaxID=2763012 RepID=UPI001648C1FE|nr:GNAT family N-acetyltransferase [Fluviispira vulneris]